MTEKDRNTLWKIASHLRLVSAPGRRLAGKTMEAYADTIDEIAGKNLTKPEGTVRARIAVAVTDKGDWSSCGWKNCPNDKEAESMAFETLDYMGSQVVHFIEADVPLPVATTIPAEVQP